MCEQKPFSTVIVRGYGGEPVVLTAHRVNEKSGYVYVAKPWAKRTTGFPLSDVFEYDDWCFTKLKRAYDAGDQVKLSSLYKDAVPFRVGIGEKN